VTIAFDEEMDPTPASEGGGGLPERERSQSGPVATGVMTGVVEPVAADVYFFDSAVVVFRRDSLKPLRSYRSVETDISEFEITARYDRARALVRKQTVDGTVEDEVKLPERTYSVDMIPVVLRGLPLDPGVHFRMNLVVPMEFRTIGVKVQVLGTKLVSTGLGDIMCREVVVIFPSREVRYWLELAQPHRFVGMRDMESETQSLLTDYSPAHVDSAGPAGSTGTGPRALESPNP
jgi:hypothetical protein